MLNKLLFRDNSISITYWWSRWSFRMSSMVRFISHTWIFFRTSFQDLLCFIGNLDAVSVNVYGYYNIVTKLRSWAYQTICPGSCQTLQSAAGEIYRRWCHTRGELRWLQDESDEKFACAAGAFDSEWTSRHF